MRKTIYLLLFVTLPLCIQSQTFKNLRVADENGETFLLKNVTLNIKSNTLNYIDENSKVRMLLLSEINKIEQKKGSYLLSGLVGGLAGSILANVITNDGENPWYFGAGPSILVGTGVATLVGGLIPRYKEIKFTNTTKLSVGLNSLKLSF